MADRNEFSLDHDYWLLTWTTFGSWLPGDRRGSTSPVRTIDGRHRRHNVPSTPAAPPRPQLEAWTRARRRAPEVRLTRADADVLLRQFHETATVREWLLVAVAVMDNHVHAVTGTDGEIDPSDLLRDFKRYRSRALNARDGTPGRS